MRRVLRALLLCAPGALAAAYATRDIPGAVLVYGLSVGVVLRTPMKSAYYDFATSFVIAAGFIIYRVKTWK